MMSTLDRLKATIDALHRLRPLEVPVFWAEMLDKYGPLVAALELVHMLERCGLPRELVQLKMTPEGDCILQPCAPVHDLFLGRGACSPMRSARVDTAKDMEQLLNTRIGLSAWRSASVALWSWYARSVPDLASVDVCACDGMTAVRRCGPPRTTGLLGPGMQPPGRSHPPPSRQEGDCECECGGALSTVVTPHHRVDHRGDAEAHTTNVLIGSLGWPRDVAFVTFAYCGWLVTSQLATRWTLINWWYEMSHYDREGDQAVALD